MPVKAVKRKEEKQRWQPIALVLGSDGKPAKVRLLEVRTGDVEDLWIVDRDLAEHAEYVKHHGNKWVFLHCAWLPLVDMYNNIVKDGTVVTHTHSLTAGLFFKQVEVGPYGDKTTNFEVCDAKGNRKYYDPRVLWNLACKDIGQTVFCNLDYSRLRERNKPGFYPLNGYSKFMVTDDNLSQDLADIKVTMMENGVSVDNGQVTLTTEFFNKDTVFIPNSWSLIAADILSATCKSICFPEKIYNAFINIADCMHLKELALPKKITSTLKNSRFNLVIQNCPKLEVLELPSYMFGGNIIVRSCSSLREIKAEAEMRVAIKDVTMNIVDCEQLKSISTIAYSYSSLTFERTEIETLTCQTSSFIGYNTFRCRPEDIKLPKVMGASW